MTLKTHFLVQTVLYKQIRECWNKLALKVNHASSPLGRWCTNQKCSVNDAAACEGLSPWLSEYLSSPQPLFVAAAEKHEGLSLKPALGLSVMGSRRNMVDFVEQVYSLCKYEMLILRQQRHNFRWLTKRWWNHNYQDYITFLPNHKRCRRSHPVSPLFSRETYWNFWLPWIMCKALIDSCNILLILTSTIVWSFIRCQHKCTILQTVDILELYSSLCCNFTFLLA